MGPEIVTKDSLTIGILIGRRVGTFDDHEFMVVTRAQHDLILVFEACEHISFAGARRDHDCVGPVSVPCAGRVASHIKMS